MEFGVVNTAGEIEVEHSVPTSDYASAEELADKILESIGSQIKNIVAVGIGAPEL